MKTDIAKSFYNSAGVPEDNSPFSERSEVLIDRIRNECSNIISNGDVVLDIGCGNGRYAFAFEKMGAQAYGIDCADEIIEYARNLAETVGSSARFIYGDALNMPFEAKMFDVIFLVGNNIVEFSYDDLEQICKQVRVFLKEKGCFCISMNDCFLHWNGKKHDPENYIANDGLLISSYEIPQKGTFDYHSYFWTIAIAKNILSRYFTEIVIKQHDVKRFWIECRL